MPRALLLLALAAGCAAAPEPIVVVHPDGHTTELEACARTCSAPTPDETQTLPTDAYYDALDQIAQAPVGQATLGIETLLFHAAETERLLEREGTGPLSEAHIRWLEHELARQTVDLSFRLVTEDGRVLGALQQQVALKTKQHLLLEDTDTLETIEVSGKTKRVGLHHLWSRF